MTPQLLCSLKPVHTQFTLYDFLGAGHDWLGYNFLNREFQLIGSKSVHFTPGQPGLEGDLNLIGLWC